MREWTQHAESKGFETLQDIKDELFQLLLDSKDYAVLLIDAGGFIRSWNHGAEFIYGYTADEIIGRHFSCLYPEEDRNAGIYQQHLQNAIATGKIEVEGYRERKSNEIFYANTIITTLYNKDRSTKGFAKLARDITLQKKLQAENQQLHEKLEEKVAERTKQLEVANTELEAFSYSVSHDLRTPLRAIGGYAEMLKEDYGGVLDGEGQRILNNIINNSTMMGRLIDDLLSFSRMARLELLHNAVNMNDIVAKCMTDLLQQWKEKDYAVTVSTLPTCKGDPTMLKQVWMNLIENAIKYSSKKESPQIDIGTIANYKNHVYYIKDNGTGFDMKYAEKLFGVFQRLHRMDEYEGTGLGLALAKRIITKHGGEIWVEAALEKGSTFYFSVPKI